MKVKINLNDLKEELKEYQCLQYVEISISTERNYWKTRYDFWIEVTAKPISPFDVILGSLFWRIEAEKYGDDNEYAVQLGDLIALLEKKEDIERLEDRCRLLAQRLKEMVEKKEVVE